jgi:outer membrane protein assembly factor BamD (BamD/ComL family)
VRPVTSAAASPAPLEDARAEPEERVADDISEQIRMLDAAKRALRRGDPARALRELNSYQQRFPAGGLAQEATVLRIRALAQAGDRETAARMARRFAARHPRSPHVECLTHLLGSASRPNPPAP